MTMVVGTPVQEFERSLQWDGYSCGARCAYMTVQHFGIRTTYAAVKRGVCCTDEGTHESDLVSYLRSKGLFVRRRSLNLRTLCTELGGGSIIITAMDGDDDPHYVVVHGAEVQGNRVERIYLADPSVFRSMRRTVDVSSFSERWDRESLLIRG